MGAIIQKNVIRASKQLATQYNQTPESRQDWQMAELSEAGKQNESEEEAALSKVEALLLAGGAENIHRDYDVHDDGSKSLYGLIFTSKGIEYRLRGVWWNTGDAGLGIDCRNVQER